MRIDYSEPRQSLGASGSAGAGKQRKSDNSSSSVSVFAIFIVACLIFGSGFGIGWYYSQKSAKKAFRAAMEQQSLESAQKHPPKQPEQPPLAQPPQQSVIPDQPAAVAGKEKTPQQQAAPAGQVPLSFFETLPKGQKQALLGSGINKNPKSAQPPAKAPAAVPSAPETPASKTTDSKVSTAGYTVQIASYTSQKEAESAKSRLSTKGYSASVVETDLNDKGVWYRLRIGRHLDKDTASDIASRVGGGAKIIPDVE